MEFRKKSIKKNRLCSLIFGPDIHYLDHLAPLSALLEIPLVLANEEVFSLAKNYYPTVSIIQSNYLEIAQRIVSEFEIAICCTPRILFDEIFFFAQNFAQKKIATIWCPHGNSDKGLLSPLMEGLSNEEVLLVYGQKMIDFIKQKTLLKKLKTIVEIGNYRHIFYLKNKEFYQKIVRREILDKLPPFTAKILYAPTWQDSEMSSSFFDACVPLLRTLPSNYSLIIKLHPNLLLLAKDQIDALKDSYREKLNVLFLDSFPCIYPLLDAIDIYLGDTSSIGYDCLTFGKPLFFLNQREDHSWEKSTAHLYQCGKTIPRSDYNSVYSIIDHSLETDKEDFSEKRQALYRYTFGAPISQEILKERLTQVCHLLSEDNPFLM